MKKDREAKTVDDFVDPRTVGELQTGPPKLPDAMSRSKSAKVLVTIVAIIGGLIIIGNLSGPDTKTVATVATAPDNPVDFAIHEINEEKAKAHGRVDEAAVNDGHSGGRDLFITFSLAPWALTEGTMKSAYLLHVRGIVPGVSAKFPQIDRIEITGEATFTDIRGNDTVEPAYTVVFWRENAAKINWERVRTDNIPLIATKYWAARSLRD
jgi:hypothetical protein